MLFEAWSCISCSFHVHPNSNATSLEQRLVSKSPVEFGHCHSIRASQATEAERPAAAAVVQKKMAARERYEDLPSVLICRQFNSRQALQSVPSGQISNRALCLFALLRWENQSCCKSSCFNTVSASQVWPKRHIVVDVPDSISRLLGPTPRPALPVLSRKVRVRGPLQRCFETIRRDQTSLLVYGN